MLISLICWLIFRTVFNKKYNSFVLLNKNKITVGGLMGFDTHANPF